MTSGSGAGRAVPRADCRRRRCHPDRDLPGHVADQGGGERGEDRARGGRHRHAGVCAGDGGNHRHACWSGRISPPPRRWCSARRAADRAELRHRAAGNGRASALAVRQLAGLAVGAAQCRPAGAGGRAAALSAGRRRAGELAGALRRRGRREPDRRLLRHLDRAYRGAGCDAAQARREFRPAPVARKPVWVPGVASLYQAVPLRQENAFFAIGERCNANGSRRWREMQEKGDWDGCVAMGREQVGEGSNALDVCTAFVGRDEMGEMTEVIRRFTSVGERAAGDRQHRDAGDRGGAEAAWRQADHQLDQFRGWRDARSATGWCWRSGSAPR